jgi:outer membrane protein assembly factor BamE (lipoprotein component of BamABCDE complex)|tara:strand:- start:93 stop:548 length:456 start_codon:yes stop_codon:yes gene_type:complete
MKKLYLFLFIFIINCGSNKVSNYHGYKSLESHFNKLEINKSSKNDIIKLIGPPSTISEFDKNKWFYLERLKTNQSLIKLGNQKIKKNNILIVQLDNRGLLIEKKMLDLSKMNDLVYFEKTTQKEFKQDNFIYNLFTGLREKINSPTRNRGK